MPPKKTAAPAEPPNPGPVPPVHSPEIESVDNPIDMDHPANHDDTEEYSLPADLEGSDLPGPSTTYIPRSPSPPLPNLSTKPFPPEEDDPEEDEIIATLPIYLSPALYPNLHIFQFPMHHRTLNPPSWAKDRGKFITTRVKEKVGRVEVEIPVDGGRDVWRDDRARDLGYTAEVSSNGHDGLEGGFGFGGRVEERDNKKKESKKQKKKEKWGDKTRYRSDLVPNATGYYSGVVHDGALHLHPISRVMQFRASLAYLDDLDIANKERRRDGDEEERKPPVPQRSFRKLHDEPENDGSGSIKDFRTKMWNTASDEAADKWIPFAWKTGDDTQVTKSLEALHVHGDKKSRLECHTKGLDYLNRSV